MQGGEDERERGGGAGGAESRNIRTRTYQPIVSLQKIGGQIFPFERTRSQFSLEIILRGCPSLSAG